MRFIAEKAPLAGALAAAAKIAERTSPNLGVTSVLLSLTGDELAVTATNYDMEIRTTIPVQGQANGAVCLPAHKLAEIVKAAPDGSQVDVSLDTESLGATVKFGRSRYKLPGLKADEFPARTLAEGAGATFTLSQGALKRLLAITAPFMHPRDSTKYYLAGIYMHRLEAELVTVGCDGHRLGRASIQAPDGAAGDVLEGPGIIIPEFMVKALQNMADGDVAIQVTDNLMGARWGDTTLTSKLVDGTYPDYRAFFSYEAKCDVTVTADAKTIRSVAARVALATSDKSKLVRLAVADDGTITFTATGENGENGEEEMPASTTAPIVVGYNARYLADAMTVCGDDKITVKLAAAPENAPTMEPTFIGPTGDEAVKLVIMPMRTL